MHAFRSGDPPWYKAPNKSEKGLPGDMDTRGYF